MKTYLSRMYDSRPLSPGGAELSTFVSRLLMPVETNRSAVLLWTTSGSSSREECELDRQAVSTQEILGLGVAQPFEIRA